MYTSTLENVSQCEKSVLGIVSENKNENNREKDKGRPNFESHNR